VRSGSGLSDARLGSGGVGRVVVGCVGKMKKGRGGPAWKILPGNVLNFLNAFLFP
jgi:hypothetical protein